MISSFDAALLAWERELEKLLLDHERLNAAAWPKGATALVRTRTGR